MKPFWIVCLVVSGAGLVVWPFFVFMSVFIFDAPFRSTLDVVVRLSTAASFFVYPGIWVLSLILGRSALKGTGPQRSAIIVAWSLAPFAWIGVIAALMTLWDYFGRSNI